ncbi:kinesin-like protein KIN-7C, mitochondrial [Coffea eugenioides]|uniref:kinesin-like protein KIN-7C, mitochondrial n=1 Tax=Coffea eugenioides TaxID=49369 RepID=UPI000F607A7A|nr:kinesin-like protein KIN-7C, mitochondrial [Coffea eugenioides]
MSASKSLRSSISPFRSRKSSLAPTTKRPPTPPSASSSSASSTLLFKPPHHPPSVSPPTKPTQSTTTPAPSSFNRSPPDSNKAKENVTVTVRFRPLSAREISKGDEVAWYADGDCTVRNEYSPSIAYGFDRVFGPATTTRNVYDVAAQHVVSGAMEGVNGTVFAYGVTSSGKTHTMHGEQKSPGIIPLAVKDVFGIIQETPGREFLLRVSYLEIYNEVINDLLDPTGQNLRIREDTQGTFVEGIKEEVVLSPAHALSLIAAGEEHRHVGSNNFNLLSSRSHTIFTLTIESSPCAENQEENVKLSQLHLIDLAGSESSKTETTGLRRKEGSYINKSLLTLGTVISKLTDGKATHIPYRDSKLTRLLQSSLSGHGRVSLICTVTPASSNSEETHNTLKFAHRSKHVEIKASQNKIMDEKSLIKKYQKEISSLKQELQQLKRGMENKSLMAPTQEDLVNLKLQVKLQSRLEEEEQAKAALMGRIQRLTKLILVSTKNTLPTNIRERPGHRRTHSFGEDELAYLPDRKREYVIDDDTRSTDSEASANGRSDITNIDELVKDYKRNRRRGMLGWFKVKKPENLVGLSANDFDSSTSGSPASSSRSSQNRVTFGDGASVVDSLPERTQAGDLFTAAAGGRQLPPTGNTITDQMDLLREQVKMIAGEVALCTSSLKRLTEKAGKNPEDSQVQEHMQKLKDEIREKKFQMRILEQRMTGSVEVNPHTSSSIEMSQALSKLATQLNEKTFELEIKSADNRVLQEQLQLKMSENAEMHETILLLKQQLDSLSTNKSSNFPQQSVNDEITHGTCFEVSTKSKTRWKDGCHSYEETTVDENTPTSVISLDRVLMCEDSKECNQEAFLNSQLLMLAAELESLKQEKVKIIEEKDGLEVHNQKLAEEASYAKELAAAAAVELRNLAEEVTKLSYENANLTAILSAARETCNANCCQRSASVDFKLSGGSSTQPDTNSRKPDDSFLVKELQQELNARHQREASLVAALTERDKIENELRKRVDDAKRREKDLENELANMWVLVAKMRKSGTDTEDTLLKDERMTTNGTSLSIGHKEQKFEENDRNEDSEEASRFEELKACYDTERKRCKELESLVSRLKGDDIGGLDLNTLEEMQSLHVEAITKICHAKYINHISS